MNYIIHSGPRANYPQDAYPPAPGFTPVYSNPIYTTPPPSTGGWWSGAMTGGLLGYMFGRNRGNGGYYSSGYSYRPRASSSSSSGGSHTTSGYGGTSRR